VLQVDPDTLTPTNKTMLTKQLGKPVERTNYQAKLMQIPVARQRAPIALNSLRQWIDKYPQSTELPVLDLSKSQPVPYSLRPIAGEVQTRFKGKAVAIDRAIVFEFINDRQRDTAAHHLGLPIKANLPSDDGSTRYFAVVETATLQTYLNDRAVNHIAVKDGIERQNPILNSYGRTKDWTTLPARAQIDIVMGFAANKYIGIPLDPKSRTAMYRDNWGVNANTTTYTSTDVVMVSGNRTGKDTNNELLARHFRMQYLPLINAAFAGRVKILVGGDTGIDLMVREHLGYLGYELQQNAAGIYEATITSTKIEKIEGSSRSIALERERAQRQTENSSLAI
jgi:hypothetical protein